MTLTRPLILASGSPRRKQLLEALGLAFDIRVTDVPEVLPEGYNLRNAAHYLALLKADAARAWTDNGACVLTADTVVLHEGTLLGKPADHAEALRSLRALQAGAHEVVTAFVLQWRNDSGELQRESVSETARVYIAPCTDAELAYYVAHNEVLDKAGGYGVQDWFGWSKVTRIEGSYANVMGLPTATVWSTLLAAGLLK